MECVYFDTTHPPRQKAWERLGFDSWHPRFKPREGAIIFVLHAQEIPFYLVRKKFLNEDWSISELLKFVDGAVGVGAGVVLYSGGSVADFLGNRDFSAYLRCWVYDKAVPISPLIVVGGPEGDELFSHSERMKNWFLGLPTWEETVAEWLWGAWVSCSYGVDGLRAFIDKTSLLPSFPFHEAEISKLLISGFATPIFGDEVEGWLDFARRIREEPESMSENEVLAFKESFLEMYVKEES